MNIDSDEVLTLLETMKFKIMIGVMLLTSNCNNFELSSWHALENNKVNV